MPSGYTSKIYEGKNVSGKEFIMECARAFGACITMRDDSFDTPIPEEFKPDTYHLEQIEKAKEELNKYQKMNKDEIQKQIDEDYNKIINQNKKAIKEKIKLKNRYLYTLAEVTAWMPPTNEHVNLKEYAIKQLKDSIDWDCNTKYYEEEVKKLEPTEWLDYKINSCLKDIEYHSKEYANEIKRVSERNKWIKDLRDSLK